MQKDYTIKVYNLANVFQRVLSPTILMSSVTYSESLNGGQGQLTLKLKLPFNTTEIGYNNIVRVYETDDTHAPRLIYAGVVGNIVRQSENTGEYIEVRCIGLASLLSMFYFYSTGYTFTKSQAGSTTIKNIIDFFSTKYPGLLSYTVPSIDTVGSVSLDFNYTKCFDAIKSVGDAFSNYWWTIRADGVFHFHPISTVGTLHKVQVGRNVDRIIVEENSEKICNQRMVKYTSGVATVSDATSITNNGLRELFVDYSSRYGSSSASATLDATNFVDKNKVATRKITVEINSNYDLESIHAGDSLTVENFEYGIVALKVAKLDYNSDRVKVELEDYSSFTDELFN